MKPISRFNVTPFIPEKLKPLRELASNLWWSWEHEAVDLFRHLDKNLWEKTYHNPIAMLSQISQEALERAAKDPAFIGHLEQTIQKFKAYMGHESWFNKNQYQLSGSDKMSIAYFSAEYGITECMPIYSGGLGVLSGDHLKSASYLGIPLVAVGLMYQHGYFRQEIPADGWQLDSPITNDFHQMPIELERRSDGAPLQITVDYPEGKLHAQLWRAEIGRVKLYLLDTNIPENSNSELRSITHHLYGGDSKTRIMQEMLLGIGGYRALIELGFDPTVCHINEGHAAFMAIERIRQAMNKNSLSFDEALQATVAGNIFTTHTPVPAGIDVFTPELVKRYLRSMADQLGISMEQFMALGQKEADRKGGFSMAILALNLSSYRNGVSRIHGEVSRKMWGELWSGFPEHEIPITHVTNSVHTRSWLSGDMKWLFNRYLGTDWHEKVSGQKVWEEIDRIPDVELWRTHERRRERLVSFARQRLQRRAERIGMPPSQIEQLREVLNPSALTIGFARRFATYKRATLLLQDLDRLREILNDPIYPVQIIFAGKAHPNDYAGKLLIQEICKLACSDEDLKYKIVFIEDYDMVVARYLVQGVDVWLNNPLRPNEASGTSGMKAAANGVLNLSIPDGWWAEATELDGGWSIGDGTLYEDRTFQDNMESNILYGLLQQEVVPIFYDRGHDEVPHRWVAKMKSAMRNLLPVFNMSRMVTEYSEKLYFPAHLRWTELNENNMSIARELAHWKSYIKANWSNVRIDRVENDASISALTLGDRLPVKAEIYLGSLSPSDVVVEIYYGNLGYNDKIVNSRSITMNCEFQRSDGIYIFSGSIDSSTTGFHGYTVRVLPYHVALSEVSELGLVCWA